MPDASTVQFQFGSQGMVSAVDPVKLSNGQYQSLVNMDSFQEGCLSTRPGRKLLGSAPSGELLCSMIRKLRISSGEDPLTPSTNLRYVGLLDASNNVTIQRTSDYASFTNVNPSDVTSVNTSATSAWTNRWGMAAYSAGSSGSPWAFFATEARMLKDRGSNPYTTLQRWGVLPAAGVALAAPVTATATVTGATNATPIVVTLNAQYGLADFDFVTISGVTGNTAANGTWSIRVVTTNPAGSNTQFAIYDSFGQGVIGNGDYAGGGTIANVPANGNLDGGSESSPAASQPYDWRFTYTSGDTGNEGNPSQIMNSDATATQPYGGVTYAAQPIALHNGNATVMVWGSPDASISTINVYRAGGTFADSYYRLVTSIANPGAAGGIPNYFTFTDSTSDADLAYAEVMETDNDPPVTSTVLSPIISTLNAGTSAGWQTVTLSSAVLEPVKDGSQLHVNDGSLPETVTILKVVSTSQFIAFFQYAHANSTQVEVDAITGQPCCLVATVGQYTVVAGDPNGAHYLYMSKAGRPEAFPVVASSGGANSINVGTPANGIQNLCEFRGQVACLNVSSIFEVAIDPTAGLTSPVEVVPHGLVSRYAWCKTDNELWFLSTDGIWSWNGGFPTKRSAAIDPIFHGRWVGGVSGIAPISFNPTYLNKAYMAFYRGQVRLIYLDASGNSHIIVCEPAVSDRWQIYDQTVSGANGPTVMLTEEDTGSLILSRPSLSSAPATFSMEDRVEIVSAVNETSDEYTSAGPLASGSAIPFSMALPWFDLGKPNVKKLFEEIWLEVDTQANATYASTAYLQVQVLLDFVTTTAVDTFTIALPPAPPASGSGRQPVSLLPQLLSKGAKFDSFGREARAISFIISGAAYGTMMTFYSLIFQYQETGLLTSGGPTDWLLSESGADKRLYQMRVYFDTQGVDQALVMDTMTGRDGKTYNEGAGGTYSLSNPTILGAGRALKVFPVPDQTIAKLVRVRPVSTATVTGGVSAGSTVFFKVLDVQFEKEEYPADIVSFTPWEDGGYEYDKYAQQLDLEVNTNGVAVTFQVQADGATVFTGTATQTEANRRVNITLPASLRGKKWRIYADPTQAALTSGAGMWQLFGHRFVFQKADPGDVGHSFDWDDLEHPFDKYLRTVTIEWDDTGGAGVTLQMDTLSGILGATTTSSVATFSLTGGRSQRTWAIAADTIAKKVRIYPQGGTIPAGFKGWKYKFQFDPYPADIVASTPWKDAGSPDDKNPSWLSIDMDTAGVAATVYLQNENGAVLTVSHTGTVTNRKANYAIPVDTYGKMWRLLLSAGTNGKAQLFDWGFARWHPFDQGGGEDPPDVVLWTPWTDFGYPYPKLARSLILTMDNGAVACGVAVQTQEAGTVETFSLANTYTNRRSVLACNPNLAGTLWRLLLTPGTGGKAKLWNWTLDNIKEPPALTQWTSYGQSLGWLGYKFIHEIWLDYVCAQTLTWTFTSDDGTYSITFPAHASRAVERFFLPSPWGYGKNKSRLYGFGFTSYAPAQIYADCSGLRWIPLDAPQAEAFRQMPLSELMQIAI